MSLWRWVLLVGWFVVAVAGCGEVTSTDTTGLVTRGELDAGAGEQLDAGQDEGEAPAATTDAPAAELAERDVGPTADASPPSCLTACEPCARPEGLDGPPYQTADQCAKVISCARAGGDSFNAWQTCHSSIYYFGSGGLHCAAAAAAAGCL